MWKKLKNYLGWKRWLIVLCLCLLGLSICIGSKLQAASSEEITITAAGWICGGPGAFTLTYVNDYEIGISWTKGEDAVNTMVRAAFGHVPANISDGYEVYSGAGTSCTDTALSMATPEIIYYRAWSQNAAGVWGPLFASGNTGGFMSASYLFIGLILIAAFLTWFSSRRPEILISMAAGFTWLALGFWLLLGDVTNLQLTDPWTVMLAWVFVVMTFVPFLMQMNVAIRREARGHSWTTFGKEPEHKPSAYEDYRDKLYGRTRSRR